MITIVKVCDAIMGTGKSMSAIRYMNEHPENRYVYITPYLEEAKRIKDGCPDLDFVEPSNKLKQYNFRKSMHTAALIREGRNIATTHQSFKGYTEETLSDIHRQGYVLIIDENVDVLEKFDFHPDDLQMAVEAGYIEERNGSYILKNYEYGGTAMSEMFGLLRSRELIRLDDNNLNAMFYWALPPRLITSFRDVFILTYLFEGQSLHHFLVIYDIPYEHIGIERTEDGGYRFGGAPGYVPEYVYHIKDKLHVLENEKLNSIGDDHYALSMNWFKKEDSDLDQLKKNVYNFFRNIIGDVPSDRRLWGTYNGAYAKVRGKGYSNAFLTFNAKATNAFRDKCSLVYVANLFMNVKEKQFYEMHGIEVNEDMYALSIMIQWIWRSAIRDGEDVYLYIPSKRMRRLLTDWMDNIGEGVSAVA